MSLVNEKIKAYKDQIGHYAESVPGAVEAYHAFTGESFSEGVLDAKTKQLIALGISLSTNNEICTYYHATEARSSGATEAELLETVAVASAALAGFALSQGVIRVQDAIGTPIQ